MKVFDLGELKKTARIKDIEQTKSYSQIHKSPIKSTNQLLSVESYYLSRWGRALDGKLEATTSTTTNYNSSWVNIGQGISSVAIGQQHVLILNNKNQCFAYGNNQYGQLAFENDHNVNRPTQITPFKDMKILNVVCGAYHSLVQNSKGQIYAFGFNMKGQLGIGNFQNKRKPSLIYSLLPGGLKNPRSNFFIETSQYKKKLKRNKQQYGQLTNITNLLNRIQQQEDSKSPTFLLNADQMVVKIACGPLHSVVLTNKSRLFTCGFGEKYALGNGKKCTSCQFMEIKIKSNNKIDKLEVGITTTAIIICGKVMIVGTLGDKVYESFTIININQDIVNIKLAQRSAILLSKKGDLFQLGDFYTENGDKYFSENPRRLEKCGHIQQIYSGMNNFFALSENFELYGWGDNQYNQITALNDNNWLSVPNLLRIPIHIGDAINLIGGNGTTFLLSGRALQIQQTPSNCSIEQQHEITLSQKMKSSIHNNNNGGTISNIYGTQQKNMLNQLGVQPRIFNCNMEIDFNDLVFQCQISQGGYGIIYKGTWKQTTVAIKMFKIQTQSAIKDFFSQSAAMEALRHPNIVMFLGVCTKPPNFAIVLQYCGRGSLWSTIQNLDYPLSWQQRRRFALQTAKGVHYLHTCNPPIIHRDLKSLNLLLDDSYRVKIADFGWTKGLDNYMTGKIGTYQWMAPEVIGSQNYSEKADVFSYGIILWEIASRQPPFKHLSGLQVSLEVLNNDLRPTIPKKTPENFIRLIRKCWDRDAAKRPRFKEIIKQLQCMKL